MIELRGIGKSYSKTGAPALADISLELGNSGLVAICGPAASGKSTLLNILGGIEKPDSGELVIDGESMSKSGEGKWNEYRNSRVGVVFQEPVFADYRTVFENVELALAISGVERDKRRDRVEQVLKLLEIEDCASLKPSELSGTQKRLTAIARALAKNPDILIADDPLSGLDQDSAENVLDALKRVSQQHLVVMATNDAELAANHADRSIRLENGTVVDAGSAGDAGAGDAAKNALGTSPVLPATAEAIPGLSTKARRSMPFFSAAAYSIRNIPARKGQAILTAIASAISMIGIAAIVALCFGANNYIDAMEENSIPTDPIVVGKSGLDLTGLLGSEKMKQLDAKNAAAESAPKTPGTAKINTVEGSIENVAEVLAEMNSHVRNNDLAGFKRYLDSNSDGILDQIETVQYDYGTAPLVYYGDTSRGVEVLNPSTLTSMLTRRANTTTSALNALGGFHEMLDNQRILDERMDVITGTWPKNSDECVIVLDENGGISDLTLYNIGLYDHDAVDKALSAAANGENAEFPASPSELSYDELMQTSFIVLPRTSLYQKNAQRGTWADKSLDDDYVAGKLEQDGIRLKVVGIVQPKKDAGTALMTEGVGYTHDLTKRLIDISAQSEIVKEQLNNPTIDVFTGKTFEDLKEHPTGNLDTENIITINQSALAHLIGMFTIEEGSESEEQPEQEAEEQETEEQEAEDSSIKAIWDSIEQMDWSEYEIDMQDVLDAINAQRLFDAIALASMLDPATSGLQLTEAQQTQVRALTGEMVADFTVYAIGEGATADDLKNPQEVSKYWASYLKTSEGKQKVAEIDLLVGQGYGEVVRTQLENYLMSVYTEVIVDEMYTELIDQALVEIEKEFEAELERQLPAITEKMGKELEQSLSVELERFLDEMGRELETTLSTGIDYVIDVVGQGISEVAGQVSNDLSNLIRINLNEEDLVAYMNNILDGSEIGYDNNLAKLGYANMENPLSVSIYPKDLAAKRKVVEIIEGYNVRMENAGMKDRTIIYNNSSGDLSNTLSTVVGVVGLALSALIGVALIVGSIMMVIIIYTGISARRREMGLLRTLGASRGNLMTMFNVETLVEGLLAGGIAVGVVYAISAAVNGMARSSGGADIMALPPQVALGIVALSGVLPLLAGLIPSLIMSFKSPAKFLNMQ